MRFKTLPVEAISYILPRRWSQNFGAARLLYDPTSDEELPADIASLAEALNALNEKDDAPISDRIPISGGDPPVLDRFDVKAYVYETTAKANTGFLAGLLKAEAGTVSAGIVQEAKRYTFLETGKRKVEFGVGIRLAVATTSVSAEMNLTIPNLAAACQLNMAKTRAGIYVVGYSGPIGDILPTPKALNVETYAEFVNAFVKLQERIFGTGTEGHVASTILGWDDTP